MALLKFLKGNYSGLDNLAIKEGQLMITNDTRELFVDVDASTRIKIGDFTIVANIAALEALDATKVPTSRLYYVEDGNILARSNGTTWIQVNKQKTAEELKTFLGLGAMAYKAEVAEADLAEALKEKINTVVEGNHAHENKTVLDGITTEKVAAWDAAEQNAKDYADSLADNYAEAEHTHTASEITDLDTTIKAYDYATKTEAEGYANAKDNAIAEAKKAGTDAAAALETYKGEMTTALAGKAAAEHEHTVSEITDFATEVAKVKVAEATKATQDGAGNVIVDTYATKTELGDVDKKFENYTNTTDMNAEFAKKADKSVVDAMYTNTQIDTAVQGAKDYAKGLVDAIPAQTDYTVTITENTDDNTVAKTYVFSQCGAEIGSIKLAKELVVTSGSVKEVTEAGKPYAGAVVGDKYIELVIANQDEPIFVPAKSLVDIYTATENATEVQVAISNENKISATLVNGGITEEKLAEGVKTKLNKTWEEVGVAADLVSALENGQVKTNKEAIEAINDGTNGILAQAKSYADGKDSAMNTRVEALEAIDHTHANAEELAKIATGDVEKWNKAVTDIATLGDTYATDEELEAAIEAEVKRADEAYDAAGAAADAQSAAEAKAAELDAALKTELEGTITDGDAATLEAAKTDASNKAAVVLAEAQAYADQAEADAVTAAEGKVNALAGNVYTKEQTYTQDEVDAAIEQACSWGEF